MTDHENKDSSPNTNAKSFSSKPVSTIVGRAFDAIELAILQDEINKNKKNQEEKSSSFIGTFSIKLNKEDPDLKSALEAIKEGEAFLEKQKAQKKLQPETKSNIKVIKTLKSSSNENNKNSNKEPKNKLDEPTTSKIEYSLNKEEKRSIKKEKDIEEDFSDSYDESYYLEEEKKILSNNFNKSLNQFSNNISIISNKLKISALKLCIRILKPIVKLFPNLTTNKDSDIEIVKPKKEEKILIASFNDLTNLNITFTDNYDVPLYKKNVNSFSKSEEELIMANAILAIQQCAEFTKDSPPISDGRYKDQRIEDIMELVSPQDISMFLGYVKSKPKKYVSKSWKISETFATWLINNSPMSIIEVEVQ